MTSTQEINICYYAPAWPPEYASNGITTYLKHLITGLEHFNITPTILSKDVHNTINPKIPVINMDHYSGNITFLDNLKYKILYKFNENKYKRNYLYDLIIYAIEKNRQFFDIIEIEESFGIYECLQKSLSSKIIVRTHGPWFIVGKTLNNEQNSRYLERVRLEGKGLNHDTALTCPSADVLEKIRNFYNKELPYAEVIANPINPSPEQFIWGNDSANEPILLFVGRFDSVKGGDIVLDSFRIIASYDKNVKLYFIGPDIGIIKNGRLVKFHEYIKQNIREHHIKNRIKYLGKMKNDDIRNYRKAATATIIASRYETFPYTLLEAFSQGCPVIATSVGGIKEIINDHENGLLTLPESPESIAEKALHLINNPSLQKQLSRNSMLDCKNKYHPNIIAEQTLSYYKKFL